MHLSRTHVSALLVASIALITGCSSDGNGVTPSTGSNSPDIVVPPVAGANPDDAVYGKSKFGISIWNK